MALVDSKNKDNPKLTSVIVGFDVFHVLFNRDMTAVSHQRCDRVQ